MWDKLKKLNEKGIAFPLAKDSIKNEPSVTLFFLYITNALAFISLIILHFKTDSFIATTTTCIYSIVWAVLYLMRRIQKAKIDLDDKSIELEGEEDEEDTASDSN